MEDCIFCKIINRQIPSDIIYEDDQTLAILDIRPVSRGHALVMPKKHTEDLLSATGEDLVNTIKVTQKITRAVKDATGAIGMNVSTNNGAAAGQVIFHLHFHIIPRFGNDNLSPWPHQETEPKTRAELAEKIKKLL
ncbi:MAG: HIT family protein [Candidatus Doudnabacteria bacterium]